MVRTRTRSRRSEGLSATGVAAAFATLLVVAALPCGADETFGNLGTGSIASGMKTIGSACAITFTSTPSNTGMSCVPKIGRGRVCIDTFGSGGWTRRGRGQRRSKCPTCRASDRSRLAAGNSLPYMADLNSRKHFDHSISASASSTRTTHMSPAPDSAEWHCRGSRGLCSGSPGSSERVNESLPTANGPLKPRSTPKNGRSAIPDSACSASCEYTRYFSSGVQQNLMLASTCPPTPTRTGSPIGVPSISEKS